MTYEEMKANRICVKCNKPNDTDGTCCSSCKKYNAIESRMVYSRRIALNLCVRCGGDKGSMYGSTCSKCREKRRKKHAETEGVYTNAN